MDLKKIQNFVYKNWGWKETLVVVLTILSVVKISEYSERLAMGLTVAIILAIVVLEILMHIFLKSIDCNSE